MTLLRSLRNGLKAPSLVIASLLFAAACASAPARPPVQIGTGDPRMEPATGEPGDLTEKTPDVVDEPIIDPDVADSGDGGLTPPHMADRDIQRAAILLPFSHPNANVRAEAEAMLAGIELALFEYGDENFLIIPKDTAGKTSVAEARTDEAISEGANVIIGPLFAGNVKAVRGAANRKGVPVVAFSNDRSAAGGGAYLASIAPEEEVQRVMEYATARGVKTFVYLGPDNDYGRRVESAMRVHASRNGAVMASSAFYDASNTAPVDEARQIATVLKAEIKRAPNKVAVMIPERGIKLLSVAPLLPYNGVDLRKVKMLGTGQWNDASVWREPSLYNGVYAGANPQDMAQFEQSFQRIYGRKPTELAAAAYDAAALAVRLAGEQNLSYSGVTDPDGFMGVNGLFRFRLDGTSERGLSVLQIKPNEGAVLAEEGKKEFGLGGS